MTDKNQSQPSVYIKALRLLFILICVNAVGFVGGSFVTPDRLAWYRTLPLSDLTPPDWMFSVVWIVLYFLMAISAFLTWNKASPRYFALQLATTVLWPFVFFYLHSVIGGVFVILAMLVFLAMTIKTFYPVSKTAAFLLIPQFLWGLFALYLNGIILIG